jgi:hypothetical protein
MLPTPTHDNRDKQEGKRVKPPVPAPYGHEQPAATFASNACLPANLFSCKTSALKVRTHSHAHGNAKHTVKNSENRHDKGKHALKTALRRHSRGDTQSPTHLLE